MFIGEGRVRTSARVDLAEEYTEISPVGCGYNFGFGHSRLS